MPKDRATSQQDQGARITAVVAMIVALAVMIATVLVVAPPGTPGRAQVRSAVLPYFGQNWRVFAPDILKTDRTWEIRAQWRDPDGRPVESDWVSITSIELRAVTGHLAPSRIAKSSWNASGTYLKRYLALAPEQRERARESFTRSGSDGWAAIPDAELIARLGTDDPEVIRFLRMDYMLMRYATMYAAAGFDRSIQRVQWRIVRERPNDFNNRFVSEAQFMRSVTTFGWRRSRVDVDLYGIDEYRAVIQRHGADWLFRQAA